MPILEKVPTKLVAGDTWRFTLNFPDYLPPTWDLTFFAENQMKAFSQASVDSGTDHAFTIAAAVSAAIPPGRYRWRIRATDGSIIETADDGGWLDVLVDPAAAGTHDTRSRDRRTLDAVEAFLEGNATTAQMSTSIEGLAIQRWPLEELIKYQDRLRARVRAEESGGTPGNGRNIKGRLGRA